MCTGFNDMLEKFLSIPPATISTPPLYLLTKNLSALYFVRFCLFSSFSTDLHYIVFSLEHKSTLNLYAFLIIILPGNRKKFTIYF